MDIPTDGLVVFAKRECETCEMVRPLLAAMPEVRVYVQDKESARAEGWVRDEWRAVSGLNGFGEGLPAFRPGCGSKSREPGVHEQLTARFGETGFTSRRVEVGTWDDPIEGRPTSCLVPSRRSRSTR